MAIDKKIYNTLETGAKNQITSAYSQGNKEEAERLYQSFLPKTEVKQVASPVISTPEAPKIETPTIPTPEPVIQPQVIPKVETPKVETTKLEVGATPEQIRARQEQITTNLNLAYNDPNSVAKKLIDSGDYQGYKNIYSSTNPEEAKVVDAFYQANQSKDTESIYSILLGGQTIQNKNVLNTPEYSKAKNRYDDINKFSKYSVSNFQSALLNGDLLPGTNTYNDLVKDPAIKLKLENAQKLNTITGKTIDTQKVGENITEKIINSPLGTALADNFISKEELNSLINTVEIQEKAKDVESKKNRYDKKKAEYDNIETDIEEQLKGTGATTTDKNRMVANARKLIYKDLAVADSEYQNAYGTYTGMKKDSLDLFTQNLGLYKEQKASEQARTDKLEQRSYEEQQREKQLKDKFDYTYGDLTSTNPQIQKTAALRMAESIQKQYEGMPFRRSVDIMADDIISQINSGITTKQITEDITNAIQNAPDYANWKANNDKLKAPTIDNKPFSVSAGSSVYDPAIGTFKTAPDGTTPEGNGVVTPSGVVSHVTDYIKSKEGFRENAYQDSGGVWTVGYGFTNILGKPVKQGDTIDQQSADELLQKKILQYQNFANKITVPLSETQKAALTSFEYNLGSGIWDKKVGGGQQIINKINSGDFAGASNELKKFNTVKGTVVKGLTNRRIEEASMLMQSGEPDMGPVDAGSGTPITYARRIKNMIPSTLQNSELEAKNINDTIKALYTKGVSAEDAALAYMGVELKPEVKNIGINMIDRLKGTDATPGSYTAIADALNKGNQTGAVQLLENTLYKQRGILTLDITEIGNNVKNGTNLINKINTLKTKFGPISGNETKLKQYIENDKETARLISDMTNFVAKYRNGIAGTNVTRNEDDFINNIIPTIINKPDNAIAKIESNIGQSFKGLNTIRDTIGLPTLQDQRSSYDINLRKQAFTGRGSLTITDVKNNQKTTGQGPVAPKNHGYDKYFSKP